MTHTKNSVNRQRRILNSHSRYGLLALLLCGNTLLMAQTQVENDVADDRITTQVRMLGIGSTNILDTYLSPEKYQGADLRFISHTTREREGKHLSRQIIHNGNVSYVHNRAGNSNEFAGNYNFSYAWHYNWRFFDNRFRLSAGALADVNIGFIYNTRNSNNPAQARANFNIAPSAVVSYRVMMKNRPMILRYEVSIPLLGVMFSPNYGQSYYEIFSEGNYDHNIVPTTFISTPSMRHMFSIDFQLLRNTTLRVGYLGDYQQSQVNLLKTHIYTHSLVVGVVKRFKLIHLRP